MRVIDLKHLYSKQMTRAEFLRFTGIGILTLLGVTNFISFLLRSTGQSKPVEVAKVPTRHGFGSRKFGD